MKPSRPKEEREADQIDRGLAADRLITDEVVIQWFASEERRLVSEMLSAAIADDAKRRDCAVQIQALKGLKTYLQTEATLGLKLKAKTNG
jgi:hypothetical protein